MKPKKNPKAELKRNSTLFFMIGLTAVLCMSYTVIEWKTYETAYCYCLDELNHIDEEFEQAPPLIKLLEPPKPKIQTPPIIEIAPDDPDIIETFIEPNDPNPDTEIVKVSDVDVAEEEEEPILIDIIEDAPIFPGCENAKDKRACFQQKIIKHVRKTFRYPQQAVELRLQGRVTTQFIIDKQGNIIDLKLHGPDELLKKEAARIVSKLPQMSPGKQNGKAVKVAFTLPITFQLQ